MYIIWAMVVTLIILIITKLIMDFNFPGKIYGEPEYLSDPFKTYYEGVNLADLCWTISQGSSSSRHKSNQRLLESLSLKVYYCQRDAKITPPKNPERRYTWVTSGVVFTVYYKGERVLQFIWDVYGYVMGAEPFWPIVTCYQPGQWIKGIEHVIPPGPAPFPYPLGASGP